MKPIGILVGILVVALTAALPYAVAAAEQREDQTGDYTNKEQKAAPPTPAVTQPGPPSPGNGQVSNNKPAAGLTILYKPPLGLGAPTGLVAGGSRGTDTCLSGDLGNKNAALTLSVLAPTDHIGLTVHEQPSLYWY